MSAIFSTSQESCRQQLCELRKPECLNVIYSYGELSLETQVVHAHEVVRFSLVDLSTGLQGPDQAANVDSVGSMVQVRFYDELANCHLELLPCVDNYEMGGMRSRGIEYRRFIRKRGCSKFFIQRRLLRGRRVPALVGMPDGAFGSRLQGGRQRRRTFDNSRFYGVQLALEFCREAAGQIHFRYISNAFSDLFSKSKNDRRCNCRPGHGTRHARNELKDVHAVSCCLFRKILPEILFLKEKEGSL